MNKVHLELQFSTYPKFNLDIMDTRMFSRKSVPQEKLDLSKNSSYPTSTYPRFPVYHFFSHPLATINKNTELSNRFFK